MNLNETLNTAMDGDTETRRLASLGRMALGIVHDANTPLGICITAISQLQESCRGISEAYRENRLKKSELADFLATIEEISGLCAFNLDRMAELLRSFQRTAVDEMVMQPRRFRVREYLSEVLRSLQPELRKTRLRVHLSAAEEIEADSYPGAYAQIVVNLVMNSLKHGYETGAEGNIELSIERKGDKLHLRYADDGKGIPASELQKIFDVFYTNRRDEGGFGLGLHVVHQTVTHLLRGSIECHSQPGWGTMFDILIPIATQEIP